MDDLLVYKEFEAGHFLLVVNASNISKDYDWICSQAEGYDVKVENASAVWGEIALQGPLAEKIAVEALGLDKVRELGFYTYAEMEWKGDRMIVSRTGYTGEDGFEIYCSCMAICEIWDILLEAGVEPCGLGCRDTLRFEAGLPLYGHELSDTITPVEAGLGMFVKLDKDRAGRQGNTESRIPGGVRWGPGRYCHNRIPFNINRQKRMRSYARQAVC